MSDRPRLVATDVDGTILRTGTPISGRMRSALRRVADDPDATLVLVTGRPPRWVWPVRDELGISGLAVCANGAAVVDLASGALEQGFPIAPEVVLEAAERLRARLSHLGAVTFGIETGDSFGHETQYRTRLWSAVPVMSAPLPELVAQAPQVLKLLMRVEGTPADELHALAHTEIGSLVTVTHSNSADSLLEISASGVTKASTLAGLAERLGVPATQAIAFGDMPNDIPMLVWAGTGFAIENGHPDALAAADAIAPGVSDDGVAQILEQWF